MKQKVLRVIYKRRIGQSHFDYKVELMCGHIRWSWNHLGEVEGSKLVCNACSKDPHRLEVIK